MAVERQELHCHNCDRYVQFDIDLSLNGNHVLKCPNCGHEHCRVVRNGRITGDRWDSRNGPVIYLTNATTSNLSTWDTMSASSATTNVFLYGSWMNTATTS